ncbi:uncharacterized protein [Henckelia pumila]|uniref:uncharacterized protein isoform X1 n=1 Tax=Henckelia pumila TaxID=405737 RepID=UPI003C6E271E
MLGNYRFRPYNGKILGNACSVFRCLSVEANPLFRWNSEITSCFKKHDVISARKLFDRMPRKNVVTWNCMISGYIKNGMINEARVAFDSMPTKNVVSWTSMLNGYAKNGRLEEARRLFDAVEKKNDICWNCMISGYVSNGKMDEALMLFGAMQPKNDVSCSIIIEGYFRYEFVSEAERLFEESSRKSVLLCNAMLAGYTETGNIDKSYKLFIKMAERDVASWTCMIKGFMRVGEVERARRLFEEMPVKDVVAWTVTIQGYLDHKRIDLAQELFDKMPYRDIVAWNLMLTGYVRNAKVEDALDFFLRMPERNVISWNLILRGYLQQDNMTGACNFFHGMPQKDETSWNTLISCYQSEEALILYVQMLHTGFKPDQGTLSSVISVCGFLAIQGWGKAMHVFVFKTGYENDCIVMSSLISMYSRCGFIGDATLVFQTMKKRDTVAWNAIIMAIAHHYSAMNALDVLPCMIRAGCHPDHTTYLILLTACAHSGLVNEGWNYLKSMEGWNLSPKPEHYASMVDLLGRSGLLAEAFDFVDKLPVDLPAYAWETLLSACRVHDNYEFSDLISNKILSYPPHDVGICVLQSNVYSARGLWKDAARVRAKLKLNKLKKELGCSWIDINGSVSCFSYNDKSHIQTKEIYKELEGLTELIDEFIGNQTGQWNNYQFITRSC